jgi:hypothetical protein
MMAAVSTEIHTGYFPATPNDNDVTLLSLGAV